MSEEVVDVTEIDLPELKARNLERINYLGVPPAGQLLAARIEAVIDALFNDEGKDIVEAFFEVRISKILDGAEERMRQIQAQEGQQEEVVEETPSGLAVAQSRLIVPGR